MASRVALALLACWAWHWSRGPCSSQSPEGLAFARVARPGRNTKSIRPRRRSASLLADLEEEEQQTRSQPKRRPVKSVKKSLRVPLKGGCCKYRVQRHWRWQQMLEEPLGVYACCNDTGPPRYHALFVSEPGMQEFLGCFPTPKMAAEAFDWRAREASWRVVNYPISADEDDAKTLLQDKFTIYRARGFPYPPQDETWREEQLHELLRANATALWTSPNTLRLPDLEYGEGLQLCWSFHPHSYDVSKTQSLRKDGALKKKPSALGTFRSDAGLIKSLRTCIERGGDPDCSPVTLRAECKFHDDSLVFKGGGSWIANFAPTVAAALYERFGGKGGTVYDPSAGWGGRMLGARLAGVRKYISCEPSTKTFEGLEELASFAAGDLEVDLRCCGSELFVPDDTVDLVFTSPPYFNTELYSKEATQSHVKFPTAQTWRLGFLEPTLRNAAAALRPGGYFLLALTARRTHRRAGLDLEADVQEIAAALGLQQDLCPCWGIIQAMGACCSSAKRAGHGLEAFPSKADAMEAEADLQESDDDDQKVHLFVEVTSTCCPAAKRDEQGLEAAEEPIGAFTARASKVELQEKLRIYEERAKQQPQDAGAHWSLGGLRLALGNFAAAERAYAEAARLEPGDEFARFGLGQAREKQGKLAAAAEAYAAAQHLGYDGGEALNRVSKELEKEAAEAVKCPVKAP